MAGIERKALQEIEIAHDAHDVIAFAHRIIVLRNRQRLADRDA